MFSLSPGLAQQTPHHNNNDNNNNNNNNKTLHCDWSVLKFIEVNFSKLINNYQIFKNDFGCCHYHLCKISSQIIEGKILSPYDFLEMNSL